MQVSLVIGPVSDYLLDVKISEVSVVFVLDLTLCLKDLRERRYSHSLLLKCVT